MSANNYLLVRKETRPSGDKPEGETIYTVQDCDMESERAVGFKVGEAPTLEGAIEIAQKYQQEEIVEYGLHFAI